MHRTSFSEESSEKRATSRVEHDLLGERAVPADPYWGIHTLRAVENFPITGRTIGSRPEFIKALASVKEAGAEANRELGRLDARVADAIVRACREIRQGALHDQFVVDVIQGGAGTSTNMNANEVIANRSLEILGLPRGRYDVVHPLDHVNRGQSTNDVYPTAIRIALIVGARLMRSELGVLANAFATKSDEFADVVKMGRTQLQDAVPLTLGQELHAYATTLREDVARLEEVEPLLGEINLGGTAIGTGIAGHPHYAARALSQLRRITGLPLTTADDLIEATQDVGVFVLLSGVLKRAAVKLSKICNDLRLLASGPRAGLGEITLPAVQAGSSIMPGKINPVIPEALNQIAFEVAGHDVTVTMAAEAGQLQLNAFEPIIAEALFDQLSHLAAGARTLATRCVTGIGANRAKLRENVDQSIGLAAALAPIIGYESATQVARRALEGDQTVMSVATEHRLIDEYALAAILRDAGVSADGYPDTVKGAP